MITARPKTPPTTPPAMAPTLLEDFWSGLPVEDAVAVAEAEVEDEDEDEDEDDEVEDELAEDEEEDDEDLEDTTWPFTMNEPCPALQQAVAPTPQQ
jgi:hypothetical protein